MFSKHKDEALYGIIWNFCLCQICSTRKFYLFKLWYYLFFAIFALPVEISLTFMHH